MRAKQRPGWKRQVGTLVSTKRGVNRFPVQGWEIETAPLPRVTSLAAGRALPPSGEPHLLKGRRPRVPPGRTHKPARAPGRASSACGPDAAAAARCGASRRRRARRDRRGRRVPPWPPSPRPRRTALAGAELGGGASRGLLDVRAAAAAGNPRAVPSAFVGDTWAPQGGCCGGQNFYLEGARFGLRGKQLPRRLWARPGRGLGVAFLNLATPGPESAAKDAFRRCLGSRKGRDPVTPGLYRDRHQAQV